MVIRWTSVSHQLSITPCPENLGFLGESQSASPTSILFQEGRAKGPGLGAHVPTEDEVAALQRNQGQDFTRIWALRFLGGRALAPDSVEQAVSFSKSAGPETGAWADAYV